LFFVLPNERAIKGGEKEAMHSFKIKNIYTGN
jgi:hypothetical protein